MSLSDADHVKEKVHFPLNSITIKKECPFSDKWQWTIDIKTWGK